MVSRIALGLLAFGLSAQAAIDFIPRPIELELEGVKSSQPGFRDGRLTVTFAPPGGWGVEGQGTVLLVHPAGANSALARVETRPLPATPLGSEEGVKETRAYLAGLLPPEAKEVRWETETEKNPVLLNRHETLRLEASYTVLGQTFRATVIVCHLQQQQLLFVLSARDRDFARLYEEWRRSLFTWQGLQ